MANEPQGGEIISICRALVLKFDVQSKGWINTGGLSRVHLLRASNNLYKVEGRLGASNGQVTIHTILGPTTEYSCIGKEPECYRLTISPQELYTLTISSDSEGKQFSFVVENVLRTLRVSRTAAEELPTSPREAWISQVVPPSPSQQISNLGNRMLSTSKYPISRHLLDPEQPIGSTLKGLSASTPNLNEQMVTQNQQTISTLNTSYLPVNDQKSWTRRSNFEAQIETLCEELAIMIRNGDELAALEIVKIMTKERMPLSIKMKNPKVVTVEHGNETIDLKVVVEDRETSGGVFIMKVLPMTTIEKLQEEVAERFGFPPKVQKWIIGKKVASPSATLADFHVKKAGYTAFLYLVSGKSVGLTRQEFERYSTGNKEGHISASSNGTSPLRSEHLPLSRTTSMPMIQAAGPPRTEAFASHFSAVLPSNSSPNQSQQIHADDLRNFQESIAFNSRDNRIHGASTITGVQQVLQREAAMSPMMEGDVLNEGHSIPVEDIEVRVNPGWRCNQCTYLNTPTRPGCEMCGGDRPEDYVVPENTMIREQERTRLEEEIRQQELFDQALQEQEQTQAIAREMNFLQLVQTANQRLIQNTEEFDCAICFTTVLPGEGVVLRECLHCFCRDCLREHIRNCTDPEVQCPFQDDNFACHSIITGQEIKTLLTAEDFDKFLNRSLSTAESQAANSFHCKTPNCPGWCIYEDDSNIFHCPVCNKQNCLTCKALHFPEMDCKEYQEDLKRRALNDKAAQQTQLFLENMIKKNDAMKCPQCEIILLKKDGCDWMRCSMCKLEICWATRGPRWGPEGVGDISGGCKCRVEGKKCHAKCQNCH